MTRTFTLTMTEQYDLCEILCDAKVRLQRDLETVHNPSLRAIYAERLQSATALLDKITNRMSASMDDAA